LDHLSIADVIRCANVNTFFRSQIPSTIKRLCIMENEYRRCKMHLRSLVRFTSVEDLYIISLFSGFRHEESELQSNSTVRGELSKPCKSMRRNVVIAPGPAKIIFSNHLDELALVLPALSTLKRIFVGHGHTVTTSIGPDLFEKKAFRRGDREIEVFFASESIRSNGAICTEKKHDTTKKSRKIVEIGGWPLASIKEGRRGIVDWRSLLLLGVFFCHICLLVGIVPILL